MVRDHHRRRHGQAGTAVWASSTGKMNGHCCCCPCCEHGHGCVCPIIERVHNLFAHRQTHTLTNLSGPSRAEIKSARARTQSGPWVLDIWVLMVVLIDLSCTWALACCCCLIVFWFGQSGLGQWQSACCLPLLLLLLLLFIGQESVDSAVLIARDYDGHTRIDWPRKNRLHCFPRLLLLLWLDGWCQAE